MDHPQAPEIEMQAAESRALEEAGLSHYARLPFVHPVAGEQSPINQSRIDEMFPGNEQAGRQQSLGKNARALARVMRTAGKPEEARRIEDFLRNQRGEDPGPEAEPLRLGIDGLSRQVRPTYHGRKIVCGHPSEYPGLQRDIEQAGYCFSKVGPFRPAEVRDADGMDHLIENTPMSWRLCPEYGTGWDFENAIEVKKSAP